MSNCRKCGTPSKEGKAIVNQLVNSRGIPAEECGRGETVSRIGKPQMVNCNKCPNCGHSWTDVLPSQLENHAISKRFV